MKAENIPQPENYTQAYVDTLIKYSLFRTAGEADGDDKRPATATPEEKRTAKEEDKRSAAVTPEEIKTIDHILRALSIVEDKDSPTIHASFEKFRSRDSRLENYENALPPAPSVLRPRYHDAVAFLQEIGIESIKGTIRKNEYDAKYLGIISAVLNMFNFTTQTQTRLALEASLGKEKEEQIVETCEQSPALDKTHEGIRTLAKNLISICFENDGVIDRIERKKINAALKRIGYTSEEIDRLT